jgi:hypothetical protein
MSSAWHVQRAGDAEALGLASHEFPFESLREGATDDPGTRTGRH